MTARSAGGESADQGPRRGSRPHRAVTPRMCTWRVACSMTKNTCSWRKVMVSSGTSRTRGWRATAPAGTSSRTVWPVGARGRCRRGAGWSRRRRRRSGSRGRQVRRGCVGTPMSVPHVKFSVARRTIRARRPAGMAGRPGWVGWVVQRQATSWRCQRRMVAGVTRSPRRWGVGSSRVSARSGRGRPSSASAVWSAVGGRRAGDEAPGARSPCWCRIERGAPASPSDWTTSGRSAAALSTDHAGLPSATKQQFKGREPSFGHRQARRRGSRRRRAAARVAARSTSSSRAYPDSPGHLRYARQTVRCSFSRFSRAALVWSYPALIRRKID